MTILESQKDINHEYNLSSHASNRVICSSKEDQQVLETAMAIGVPEMIVVTSYFESSFSSEKILKYGSPNKCIPSHSGPITATASETPRKAICIPGLWKANLGHRSLPSSFKTEWEFTDRSEERRSSRKVRRKSGARTAVTV